LRVNILRRTQIYLDDEIYEFLENEKKKTHLSYSEIIRYNIKQNIQNNSSNIIDKMEKAAGSWKNKELSPEEFVRIAREDRAL
jgi:predicted CopG family antitoxin